MDELKEINENLKSKACMHDLIDSAGRGWMLLFVGHLYLILLR